MWRLSDILSCATNKAASLDSHMDADIEVKGSKSTVTVSWDKKNEEGEMDDSDKRTNASGQMTESGKAVNKNQQWLLDHFFCRKSFSMLCFES